MKKIFYFFMASVFAMGMFSCDKIEEPYIKPNNQTSDTIIPLTGEDTLNWNNQKVVLLEDYTGVRCVNCPQASEITLSLQEEYQEQLVVLGIHAGFLSTPNGGFPDFRTEEGEEWYNHFSFNTNPIGTINRQNNGQGYGYQYSEWNQAVAEAVIGESKIRLLIAKKYDEAKRKLIVSVYSKFLEESAEKYNLTVCLMEDSIVGKQVIPNDIDTAYIHRHVFRGCINGAWGKPLNGEGEIINSGKQFVNNYSITLDEKFKADNCYIVAYVYKTDELTILQTAEKKIK